MGRTRRCGHNSIFFVNNTTTSLLCSCSGQILNLIYFTHLRIFSHAIACIIRALSVKTVGDSRKPFFFFLFSFTFFVFFAWIKFVAGLGWRICSDAMLMVVRIFQQFKGIVFLEIFFLRNKHHKGFLWIYKLWNVNSRIIFLIFKFLKLSILSKQNYFFLKRVSKKKLSAFKNLLFIYFFFFFFKIVLTPNKK